MRTRIGYFLGLLLAGLLLVIPLAVQAQTEPVEIAVFVREGCGHCADEEAFLADLMVDMPELAVRYYRIDEPTDRAVWEAFTTKHGISKVTPITVIGNAYLVGFDSADGLGADIRGQIEKLTYSDFKRTDVMRDDVVESGRSMAETCPESGDVPCTIETESSVYAVTLPILGKIDTQKLPLFALSALLGFFDGFNPCAMWVLLTFLLILLKVGDRKKMFVFAGVFILAEALMYALILTVWFQAWDFVRLDSIVTPLVGLVSIIGGVVFLREWRKAELECRVTNGAQRSKTIAKITLLAESKFSILTLLGILGVAFSVNIIEFACSVGIPQAFTKILQLNMLPIGQWLSMIGVYIFFYMMDDFVVFGLALWGADHLGLTTKYSKLSNLLGGIVLILLGLLLIFRSQVLLF